MAPVGRGTEILYGDMEIEVKIASIELVNVKNVKYGKIIWT